LPQCSLSASGDGVGKKRQHACLACRHLVMVASFRSCAEPGS
jgi:hypothetical protein